MMLALGMFVFMRQTLPYQNMQRDADYRWPSNSRVGRRDAFQFLGVGEEKITLSGVLYPEFTGGRLTMTTVRMMAEEGRAWPLMDGNGTIYGMYVINNVSETGSLFFSDGSARRIDFTLTLTRVDESLAALYGDIGKQAESLVGKASGMAGKITDIMGAG
ncbi:phage tail protein [Superficieibacter sp.]|uniref:phage tail protein n=1 Tax=Superficieibacter sp. TaxID=2303322 RepID=UPI0028B12883|nr:phage tail protein [Superficieibacter sp.]